jgi:hypothetical protein
MCQESLGWFLKAEISVLISLHADYSDIII